MNYLKRYLAQLIPVSFEMR